MEIRFTKKSIFSQWAPLGLIALMLGLFPLKTLAQYYNLGAFWQTQSPNKLVITTSAQTINAATCSAITTVQSQYSSGTPYKVEDPLTVYLSGGTFLFFSDSVCTTPISSVIIPADQTTASFYFEAQGTNPLMASAPKVASGVQTETINTGAALTGFEYTNTYYNQASFGSPWQDLDAQTMAAYNGGVYLSFSSSEGSASPFDYVWGYNNNDSAPSWSVPAGGVSIAYGSGDMYHPPVIMASGGYLFAAWPETNGTNDQLRVKKFDGTSWAAADPGSLNISTSEDAEDVALGAYAGNLYVSWDENSEVHVAVYGGGTTWTRIDDNGANGLNGTSMNYSGDSSEQNDGLWGDTNGLFAFFTNNNGQLRAKRFNGSYWVAADSGSGIPNGYGWWASTSSSSVASFNGKTYLLWYDQGGTMYVEVYGGGTTWNEVDNGGFMYQASGGLNQDANLLVYQNRLYAFWQENNSTANISYTQYQTRMAVYNGNDSAPSWTLVGTPGADGYGYIPWYNYPGWDYGANATVANNKIYGEFWDSQGPDTIVFKQGTSPSKLWVPDLSDNGFDLLGCTPDEVRLVDANGYPSFATTNVTVTLGGTGVSYFSDDQCTQAVPSNQVTVNTGDSGAHFYVQISGSGYSFTASATGLSSTNQTLGLPASEVTTWLGTTGTSGCTAPYNWDNSNCWSNGAPSASTYAIFNDVACTSNCTPTVDVDIDIGGLDIQASYTGTIDLVSHNFNADNGWGLTGEVLIEGGTFNAGTGSIQTSGNFKQTGGIFNGESASIELGDYSAPILILAGGTFTSTSGTLTLDGTIDVSGTPTFNANGGTVEFSGAPWYPTWVYPGSVTFNNVLFAQGSSRCIDVHGTMNIHGDMTVNNAGSEFFCAQSSTAVIQVTGDVYATGGSGDGCYGGNSVTCTTLKMVGTTNQTIFGVQDSLPGYIVIDNTGSAGNNTVTLSGSVWANQWSVVSGNVNPGTSTLTLEGQCATFDDPAASYYNVTDTVYGSGCGTTLTGNMNVTNTLDLQTDQPIWNGNINLAGNFTASNGSGNGSTTLTFTGNSNTTYTNTATYPAIVGNITVDKTTGKKVTLENDLVANYGWAQTVNVTSGTLDMNGNNLYVGSIDIADTLLNDGSGTIYVYTNWTNTGTYLYSTGTVNFYDSYHTLTGSTNFYNFVLNTTTAPSLTIAASSTQTVYNNLSISGTSGNNLNIVSTSTGTAWNLVPPAGTTLGGYLTVQDSHSSITIHTGTGSTLVSNDTNWVSP